MKKKSNVRIGCFTFKSKIVQPCLALARHMNWWYHKEGAKPEENIYLIYNHPRHFLYKAAKELGN